MKTDVVSKTTCILKILVLIFIFSTYYAGKYAVNNYMLYKDIQVYASNTAAIEYGSVNYDIKKIVKEVEGKIVSVKKEVNTSVLGEQEVLLEVKNGNVVKTVPVTVSVVDNNLPIIVLNSGYVSITEGDSYSLTDNVSYVNDDVDGELMYSEHRLDGIGYYSFSCADDWHSVGTHTITVSAFDSFGNESSIDFTLEVKARPVVYYYLPPNVHGNDMVATAYSLIGAPYTANGVGPGGFDCSGFVHYVYSTAGINISRSTWTQLYEGFPVSYNSMQPGDIIIWGNNGVPSHSSLYVGNGQMIHATNPSQGVILSNVSFWIGGSGTNIISIRRI